MADEVVQSLSSIFGNLRTIGDSAAGVVVGTIGGGLMGAGAGLAAGVSGGASGLVKDDFSLKRGGDGKFESHLGPSGNLPNTIPVKPEVNDSASDDKEKKDTPVPISEDLTPGISGDDNTGGSQLADEEKEKEEETPQMNVGIS